MFNLKLSSEFVIFENCTMQQKKKKATLNIMHDTTFSGHTRVSMWKFMTCLAPKMSCMAYEQVVIYLFHNFMNIPHWIPWKLEEFSSSFSVPHRTPNGVTISIWDRHYQLQNTQHLRMKRITKSVTFNK